MSTSHHPASEGGCGPPFFLIGKIILVQDIPDTAVNLCNCRGGGSIFAIWNITDDIFCLILKKQTGYILQILLFCVASEMFATGGTSWLDALNNASHTLLSTSIVQVTLC